MTRLDHHDDVAAELFRKCFGMLTIFPREPKSSPQGGFSRNPQSRTLSLLVGEGWARSPAA
jgi:hypothetical protein